MINKIKIIVAQVCCMILGPCLSITGSENHKQQPGASCGVGGIIGGPENQQRTGLYYINP